MHAYEFLGDLKFRCSVSYSVMFCRISACFGVFCSVMLCFAVFWVFTWTAFCWRHGLHRPKHVNHAPTIPHTSAPNGEQDLLAQMCSIGLLTANLPNRYSAQCWRPVTHAQTWASYSALYRFGRLSLLTSWSATDAVVLWCHTVRLSFVGFAIFPIF